MDPEWPTVEGYYDYIEQLGISNAKRMTGNVYVGWFAEVPVNFADPATLTCPQRKIELQRLAQAIGVALLIGDRH